MYQKKEDMQKQLAMTAALVAQSTGGCSVRELESLQRLSATQLLGSPALGRHLRALHQRCAALGHERGDEAGVVELQQHVEACLEVALEVPHLVGQWVGGRAGCEGRLEGGPGGQAGGRVAGLLGGGCMSGRASG